MFEGVEDPPSPSLLVFLALLDVKLVMDIITLEQSTASFDPKVPQEILDIINEFISQSPIIQQHHEIIFGKKNSWTTRLTSCLTWPTRLARRFGLSF
jgi:hypothetical protein